MKPFCVAPWTTLHILPDGQLRPCAVYHGEFGDVRNLDLQNPDQKWQELRQKLQDNFTAACDKCRKQESTDGRSLRLQAHDLAADEVLPTSFSAPFHLLNLEVAFSNLCNLSCRFCSSKYSSHWIQESIYLESQGFDFSDYSNMLHRQSAPLSEKHVLQIIDQSPNLQNICLKGGEPLVQPQTYLLLKALKEQGRDKVLSLEIISNMTQIKDELHELLSGFKKVDLTVSAEAVGTAYQYIRGGRHKLETDVESSLRKLDGLANLRWTFHSLLSVYNIFEPIKFHSWLENLSLKSSYKWQFGFLNDPEYLRPNILAQDILEAAKLANANLPSKMFDIFQSHLFNNPESEESREQKRQQLRKFTLLSDQYRKRKVTEDIPDLKLFFTNLSCA